MAITARAQYDNRPKLDSDLSFEGDKGVTKQADLKDCDINLIMRRFEKTGHLPDLIVKDGRYGDFSAVPDYQTALSLVQMAQDQFGNLDVSLRNRFDNDPAKFLEFASDVKNLDEMEKLGLLNSEAIAKRQAERIRLEDEIRAKADLSRKLTEDALIARIKAEIAK